jgi:uncharacterized protein (TIGR02996 family)
VSDRDALFAAILAHPDEDTPRLVFADWLEENGQADYAAFIRKQIELAKVPEWDPLWVRAWHRDRDAVTGRGHHEFVPNLSAGIGLPSLTSFRRGFAWHVESTDVGPFLKHADEQFAALPIRALTIEADRSRWRDPINLTKLFASPHLARIKQLTFNLTRITSKAVRQMQACPHLGNLTALRFEFANLEPAAVRALFKPPLIEQLEVLSFENSSIVWSDMANGLAHVDSPHRLRTFVLAESSVRSGSEFGRANLFAAPLLRGLKELDISGYRLNERDIRALCGSPVVNTLESLTLTMTEPGVPGIKVLSECAALRGLKRLRMMSNKLGPVAAKALGRAPHLGGLQVLELGGNPLGDKGAIALAESACMANLVELELMHCEIGDAGAEALMKALSADRIINLSLSASEVRAGLSDAMKKKIRKKLGDCLFA